MPLSTSKQITLRLIIPLSIGMLLIGGYTISSMFYNIPQWTQVIQDHMNAAELTTLERRSRDRAKLASESFGQIANDVERLRDYAIVVDNQDLPIDSGSKFHSYFGVYPSVDPDLPPGGLDSKGWNYHSSVWYRHGVNDISNSYIDEQFLNATSIMDNVFRSLFSSNPSYAGIYLGTTDGLFRHYPYFDATSYVTFSYICAHNNQPTTGYDPRCRGWYVRSTDTPNEVIFTVPYVDAGSGEVLISAAREVDPSFGVVSVDVSMDAFDQQISASTVLENGYAYVIDDEGYAVLYPDLDRDSLYRIEDLEFTTLAEKNAFDPILQRMLAGESDLETFTKNDEMWHISFNNIDGTPYRLAMVVPDSDITAPSDRMRVRSFGVMVTGTILISAIFLGASAFSSFVNIKVSKKFIGPIQELHKIVKRMTGADLDVELGNRAPVSAEINTIFENFTHLITAVRFGNAAYYKGDFDKSLRNYKAAEELMIRLHNERGQGVCWNNMGNAYKSQAEKYYQEALEFYKKAIENVRKLLADQHKKVEKANNGKDNDDERQDEKEEDAYKIVLANRLMNLAVLYKDQENMTADDSAEVEKLFNESLKLHRETDNIKGIAQVSGNLGQHLIKTNKAQQATNLIEDSWETAKQRQDPIPLQFAAMNMGILRRTQCRDDDAMQHFRYALDCAETLDVYVQSQCLNHLAQLYRAKSREDIADQIDEYTQASSGGGSKDVIFVLDVSYSMDGARIRQCRQSVVSILNDFTSDSDHISLTVFADIVETIFPLMSRRDNLNRMLNDAQHKTQVRGNTAFYEGVLSAITTFDSIKNNRKNWIVALTDGEDNRSSRGCPERCIDKLQKNDVSLICITVGSIRNVQKIKMMCDASTDGMHIPVVNGNAKGIEEAFGKVAAMIAGQVNVEQL